MTLPTENRSKVANIVSKQQDQFRELYRRLALGLPGVRWDVGCEIEQDTDAKTRVLHLRKLPSELARRVDRWYEVRTHKLGMPGREADEGAYWRAVAGHGRLGKVLTEGVSFRSNNVSYADGAVEMENIVRYPATVQTVKGLVSAGFGKSVRYGAGKMAKWWKGSSRVDTNTKGS